MSSVTSSLFNEEFYRRLPNGIGIMLLQALPANFFNQLSVSSCQHKISSLEALRRIRSVWQATKGLEAHLLKEALRVGAKVLAAVHQHTLTQQFPDTPTGRLSADLVFSSSLMGWEMLINPADTRRTNEQATVSPQRITAEAQRTRSLAPILSHYYRGALANGLRQGGIWYGYRPAERYWSKAVRTYTPWDPHSLAGILARTVPVSIQILTPVWFLERLKNHYQNHPEQFRDQTIGRYWNVLKQMWKEEKPTSSPAVDFTRMMFRGYPPKVANTCVLVFGFLWLGRPKT